MKHLIRLLIQHNRSLVPANQKKKNKEIMSGKEECLPYEDWIQQELPNQCWIQQAASTSTGNWGPLPLRIDGLFCAAKRGRKNFDSILIDSSNLFKGEFDFKPGGPGTWICTRASGCRFPAGDGPGLWVAGPVQTRNSTVTTSTSQSLLQWSLRLRLELQWSLRLRLKWPPRKGAI